MCSKRGMKTACEVVHELCYKDALFGIELGRATNQLAQEEKDNSKNYLLAIFSDTWEVT